MTSSDLIESVHDLRQFNIVCKSSFFSSVHIEQSTSSTQNFNFFKKFQNQNNNNVTLQQAKQVGKGADFAEGRDRLCTGYGHANSPSLCVLANYSVAD